MTWKPIVAGVDGSPESLHAAVAAAAIARRAGADCRLVAAVPDYAKVISSYGMPLGTADVARDAEQRDRSNLTWRLRGYVPEPLVDELEVRAGSAPLALHAAAKRLGAGLIVLGSRRHHGLDRLRRSTVTWLARASDIPLLVTAGSSLAISRVLAAVDLSDAAPLVLDAAKEWAQLFDASLRVLHVAEPLLSFPSVTESLSRSARARHGLEASSLLAGLDESTEKVLRRGDPVTGIEREAVEWSADLLVIGAHGAGWIDRMLLGSSTEVLLKRPPTLMLLVPVPAPSKSGFTRAVPDARWHDDFVAV